jgi:MinD superfamily P-loop ATPase
VKQILIISGKGGTGKTVVSACFAALNAKSVLVDCDVDAADLHLLLHPKIQEKNMFKGLPKPVIKGNKCTGCGECVQICRFDAISRADKSSVFQINEIACEGCQICMHICLEQAIYLQDDISGEWYISETKYGPMVHARLGIAQENSGRLVTLVRQQARQIAEAKNLSYVIIDGPPGIGCPVIAAMAGVDIAVVVTEPTISGSHDMARVISVAKHFQTKAACIINKYDINQEYTRHIADWCKSNDVPLLGKIPYDKTVIESVVRGISYVEHKDNATTQEIKNIWHKITKY